MKFRNFIGATLGFIIIISLIIAGIWYLRKKPLSKKEERDAAIAAQQLPENELLNTHLPLGNPSKAGDSDPDNYLLLNNYFALSFNRSKGTANWVAWRLEKEDMGKIERQNDFRPDERLPQNWPKIFPSDYGDRAWSRGHMCPSGDRTATPEANSATFLMTNMLPQSDDLNTGPWEKLESYCRSLAFRGRTLYIYAGGYGDKGMMRKKIRIPTNNWKIVVILRSGQDIADISEETNIIAVDMPNIEGIKEEDWKQYKTTVRNIEQKTGLDFLGNLPKDLQEILETRPDGNY